MHDHVAQEEGDLSTHPTSRLAPMWPRVGSIVRAVVLVEGAVTGSENDFVCLSLGRGDEIYVHQFDLRHFADEPVHTMVDTSAHTHAALPSLPESPPVPQDSRVPPAGSVANGPQVLQVDGAKLRALAIADALGIVASEVGLRPTNEVRSEVGMHTASNQVGVGRVG